MSERLIQDHERTHHVGQEGITKAQKGFLALVATLSVANGAGAMFSFIQNIKAHELREDVAPMVERLTGVQLESVYERLDTLEQAVCDPFTGVLPGLLVAMRMPPAFEPELQACLQWIKDVNNDQGR